MLVRRAIAGVTARSAASEVCDVVGARTEHPLVERGVPRRADDQQVETVVGGEIHHRADDVAGEDVMGERTWRRAVMARARRTSARTNLSSPAFFQRPP